MAGSDWFFPIDMIRRSFETGYTGTVSAGPVGTIFAGPAGTVTPLPNSLGGDRQWWPALQAVIAVSNAAFFELLQRKAHFLMLPQSIVLALNDPGIVHLSEMIPDHPDVEAQTTQNAGMEEIRIPGASRGLAQAGYVFGHSDYVGLPEEDYKILTTIYHEMTHSWMRLAALGKRNDAELRNLIAIGVNDYLNAEDLSGTRLNPARAFAEASAWYVDDKIGRWCSALADLDILLRLKLPDGDLRRDRLRQIVEDYDRDVRVYGWIEPHRPIASPELSDDLRKAINMKVLDGLPLTKLFADTPLAALHAAVSGP